MYVYVDKVFYFDKCCMFQLVLSVIFLWRRNERQQKNSRRHNPLGAINLIGIVLGGRCLGVICPEGQLSWAEIFHVQLFGGIFLDGNCLGAIVLGGNCPERNCRGGNFPGGNCLVPRFNTV